MGKNLGSWWLAICMALVAMSATAAPATALVQDGTAAAVVIHPDSPVGQAQAAAVVDAVARLTGVKLPSRPGTAADAMLPQNVIMLGNVFSNPALRVLYARRLTMVDAMCPGAGGYLVTVINDPWGDRHDVVLLGASDDAGLARAVEAFIAHLPSSASLPLQTLTLPPFFQAAYSSAMIKAFPSCARTQLPPDYLEQGMENARRALARGQYMSLPGVLADIVIRYHLTHRSEEAQLFVRIMALYIQAVRQGASWGFDHDFAAENVVPGWDVIEHDPSLTAEQRQKTAEALAIWIREAVSRNIRAEQAGRQVAHNHLTFPALGLFYAGLYFAKTPGVADREAVEWRDIADRIFRLQANSYKVYENCSTYQWYTQAHLLQYAIAKPDDTVVKNGNQQRILQYALLTMDNMGYQAPYGDAGPWTGGFTELYCLDQLYALSGDPAAAWAAQLKHTLYPKARLGGFNSGASGKPPEDLNGVTVFPVAPPYYASLPSPGRPPLAQCFDKLTFRSQWSPDGLYLLLEGLGNGEHHHANTNGILRFNWLGRSWLAGNDYFHSQQKFHNTFLFLRQGEAFALPEYAELQGHGDNNDCGYSTTVVRNFGPIDWYRTIVRLKRHALVVVLDRAVIRQAGDYQFQQCWQTVGQAALLPSGGVRLQQRERALELSPLTGSSPKIIEQDVEIGKNWQGYPFAPPVVQTLTFSRNETLKAGSSVCLATIFQEAGLPSWRGDELADGSGVRWVRDKQIMSLRRDHDDTLILCVDSRRYRLGNTLQPLPDASDAVDIPVRVQPASHESLPPAMLPTLLWDHTDADLKFTRLAVVRSNAAAYRLAAGTASGSLILYDAGGKQLWRLELKTAINDLAAVDLDGQGKETLLVAAADGKLRAYNPDATLRWEKTFSFYRRFPCVNVLLTADLNADGRPEILAGCDNWRVYALDSQGRDLWNYEVIHPCRTLLAADLTGSGRPEVICGTQYYYMSVLDYNGRRQWMARFGPGCNALAVAGGDVGRRHLIAGADDGGVYFFDATGKLLKRYLTGGEVRRLLGQTPAGIDAVFAGSANGGCYRFNAEGQLVWFQPGEDPITLLFAGSYGVLTGDTAGQVKIRDFSGRLRQRFELGGRIVDAVEPEAGKMVIVTAAGRRVAMMLK